MSNSSCQTIQPMHLLRDYNSFNSKRNSALVMIKLPDEEIPVFKNASLNTLRSNQKPVIDHT